jgi:hypothetical protein
MIKTAGAYLYSQHTEQATTALEYSNAMSKQNAIWCLLKVHFVSKLSYLLRLAWYVAYALSFPNWSYVAYTTVLSVSNLISVIVLYFPDQRKRFFGDENAGQSPAEGYAVMCIVLISWTIQIVVLVLLEQAKHAAFVAVPDRVLDTLKVLCTLFLGFSFVFAWGELVSSDLVVDAPAWSWGLVAIAVLAIAGIAILVDICYGLKARSSTLLLSFRQTLKANLQGYRLLYVNHLIAAGFHMLLISFSVTIGLTKYRTDLHDFYDNWILVYEPTYLMIPNWKNYSDVSDIDKIARCNSTQCDNTGKVILSYCTPDNPLKLYILLLSVSWSIMSAVQHLYSFKLLHKTYLQTQASNSLSCTQYTFKTYLHNNALLYTVLLLVTLTAISLKFKARIINLYCAILLSAILHILCQIVYCVVALTACRQVQCTTETPSSVNVQTDNYPQTSLQSFKGGILQQTSRESDSDVSTSSEGEDIEGHSKNLLKHKTHGSLRKKPRVSPNAQTNIRHSKRLSTLQACVGDTRMAKWWEYCFSASLMHVVLLHNMGIVGAHEIMSTTVLLGVSMLLALKSEKYLIAVAALSADETHTKNHNTQVLTVHDVAKFEMPYIFLSFFSKGLLDMIFTLPALFITERDYAIVPQKCNM